MPNTQVGTVQVTLEAKDDRLRSVFKRSEKLIAAFGKGISGIASQFNPFNAIVGAVSVAAIGAFIKKGFEAADALGKQSDALGVTTQAYAGMKLAALTAGASMEDVATGMAHVNAVVLKAKEGNDEAISSLAKLGLTAEKLAGLPADKQLGLIADRLNTVKDRGDRAAIAMELLGKNAGPKLRAMLEDGSAGLQAQIADADALGLAISRVDAKQVEEANDALSTVWEVIGGIATRIAVELSPYVTALAEDFLGVARETGGFRDIVHSTIDLAVRGAVMVYDGWLRLQEVWGVIKIGILSLAKVWMTEVTFLAGVVDHLVQTYKAGFMAIGAAWKLEWKTAKLLFVEFMDWGLVALGYWMEKIGGLLNQVKSGLGDGITTAAQHVKDATNGMAEDAKKEWVEAKDGAVQAVKDLGAAYLQNFTVNLDQTSQRLGGFWVDVQKNLDDNLGIEISKLQAQGDNRLALLATLEQKIVTAKFQARQRAEQALKARGPTGTDESAEEIAKKQREAREKLLGTADQDPRVKYEREVLAKIGEDHTLAQARQITEDKAKVDAYLGDPELDPQVAYQVKVDQIIAELHEEQDRKERDRRQREKEATISAYGTIASNLDQVTGTIAQQSLAGFRLHQGTSIASAMINAWLAYSQALAAPDVPQYLKQAMAGTALAAGFAAAGQIASQRPPGRALGGSAHAGGMYQVGEGGRPELLSVGGRNYLIMGDRSGSVNPAGPGGGSPKVEVHVHNQPGQAARTQQGTNADGSPRLDIIIERVEQAMAASVADGTGPLPRTIERTYGMNRSRGSVR